MLLGSCADVPQMVSSVVVGTPLPTSTSSLASHRSDVLVVSSQARVFSLAPPQYRIYHKYSICWIFDVVMVLGCAGLCLCYAIARHFRHVGVFCDISDLVVHLPERVLFRVDFSIVGGFLFIVALPIRDAVARKVDRKLPNVGAFFQMLSGLGVILVAACGPKEIDWLHIVAAALGFGGSAIAQIIYGLALVQEDQPTSAAKRLFLVRCCISGAFLSSAIIFGLAEAGVFPEPTEHIFEWSMWVFLLLWYYTFRFDMTIPGEDVYVATVNEIVPQHLNTSKNQSRDLCFETQVRSLWSAL